MKSRNFAAIKLLIGTSLLSTTFYGYSSEVIYPIKFGEKANESSLAAINDIKEESKEQAVQQIETAKDGKKSALDKPFTDRKADLSKQTGTKQNSASKNSDRAGAFKVVFQANDMQESNDMQKNNVRSASSTQGNIELDKELSTQKATNQLAAAGKSSMKDKSGSQTTQSLDKDVTYSSFTYSDKDVASTTRSGSRSNVNYSSTPANGQVGRKSAHNGSVSLRDTINLVLNWHPIIKRSESELQQYEEHIDEVKSAYYPSVDVGMKSGFEENQYYGGNDRSSKLVVNGNQMLYDFGKTRNKVNLAESTSARSVFNLHKTVNDTIYESVSAYLQVVRYTKLVDIAEKQVAGFKVINEIAKKRSNLGASAESDYSQAKVRLASSESSLYEYKAQLYRWSSILNNLTNQDVAGKIKLNFPEEIYGVCSTVNVKDLSSPNIAMAEAQVEMAKAQLGSAKSDYFPTISLNPTYEYELENESNTNSNRKKGQFGVFVNVSASLYEGGATSSRSKQAEQALSAAKFNLETEKTDAKRKIIEATSQIQSTQYSLKAKEQREVEAIKTRDLYKLQYVELGSRSFSDLLSAESEIHQTRMDIVNSYYTISSFSVECLYQSGSLTKTLTK